MNKPKLILFDYGNTIITETVHGFDKGNEALLKTAVKNPQNITITELQAKAYEELEWIYWNNATSAKPSENIVELLEYLHKNGIRTGVVSNIMLSGNSLKRRIKEVLPENHFEFVIASSEYIYRKPEKEIFEMALIKSGLSAHEVWFCGDNPICDTEGALNAGIQPVWYKKTFKEKSDLKMTLQGGYIEINDWLELKEIIERCN